MASCGSYITGVVDAKTNKGENYAIVDGGKHQMVYYGGGLVMRQPPCWQLGSRRFRRSGGQCRKLEHLRLAVHYQRLLGERGAGGGFGRR